jgi:hypothetical protein
MSILKFLVMTIPSASLYLSTIFIGFTFSIFLIGAFFSEILGGLFQPPFSDSALFLGLSYINYEITLSFVPSFQESFLLVPVIVYSNAKSERLQILKDNKNLTGIYMFTNIESGKKYIGSAVDLSIRFRSYYSKTHLVRYNKSYIYNVLHYHGYSAFSLSILEYIDITNLSKEEVRRLIIEREQWYIDTINPEYNINPTAGSLLGYKHTSESLAKLSGINH